MGGLHDLDIDLSTVTLKTGVSHSRNHHQCGVIGHMRNPGSTETFLKCGDRCPPPLMWGVGGGSNLSLLVLWLFITVRSLNLSRVIVERSHVYKFQATEKDLSYAVPDCKCRIHQQKFADHDLLRFL